MCPCSRHFFVLRTRFITQFIPTCSRLAKASQSSSRSTVFFFVILSLFNVALQLLPLLLQWLATQWPQCDYEKVHRPYWSVSLLIKNNKKQQKNPNTLLRHQHAALKVLWIEGRTEVVFTMANQLSFVSLSPCLLHLLPLPLQSFATVQKKNVWWRIFATSFLFLVSRNGGEGQGGRKPWGW